MPRPAPLIACLLVLLLAGCGSKINEANYYRIGVGTSEEKAEEWLGPGRHVDAPPVSPGREVKAKRWQAGDLQITLLFENGKVIARKAEGLKDGKQESYDWPEAATRPAIQEGRAPKDGMPS
jgi:hypothetical protein